MDVRVSTVGSFAIEIGGKAVVINHEASRKVIAMLILSSNHTCSRDSIAATIWPDTARAKSLASLRQAALQIKKVFQAICGEHSPFKADVQSLALVGCDIKLDIDELIGAIEIGAGLDQYQRIANNLSGNFLQELLPTSDLFSEWIASRQASYLEVLKRTLRASLESGNQQIPKLQYAEFLSKLDSGDELACRTKMELYNRDGEKGKALRCYSELWKYLEEEYDVEPSNATRELAVAIKVYEPGLGNVVIREGTADSDGWSNPKYVADDLVTESLGSDVVPRIAVVPFVGRGVSEEHGFIGEVLADDIVNVLSRCQTISVISRQSASEFSGLTDKKKTVDMLRVQYLITGSYRMHSDNIVLDIEFSCAESNAVVWTEKFTGTFDEFLKGEHGFVEDALKAMGIGVMGTELKKISSQRLAKLNDYTLLTSAIALMHRLTKDSFRKSKMLFESLIIRSPGASLPYAYLSMWYVLRVNQGWSDNPEQDGERAFNLSSNALDIDPFMSLAHTLHGIVNTNLKKDLELGEICYTTALHYNPNDSLGWLLRGTLYAFQGKGEQAIAETRKAMSISPFDPHRYFYLSLAGTAAMCGNNYEEAISLSQRSLMLNSEHASTLRTLSISLWRAGKHLESRERASALLRLQPGFTVSGWLRNTPFVADLAADLGSTLREAGIPD